MQKRAESAEHFKRLVLNPHKPLNLLTRTVDGHYLLMKNETGNGKKNVIGNEEVILFYVRLGARTAGKDEAFPLFTFYFREERN